MLALMAAALLATAADGDAYLVPGPEAPVYPGGPQVECAMAVSVMTHFKGQPRDIDPYLRTPGHVVAGSTDCRAAFRAAHVDFLMYDHESPHIFLSRPRGGVDGRVYMDLHLSPRFSRTFMLEAKDGEWVVSDDIILNSVD